MAAVASVIWLRSSAGRASPLALLALATATGIISATAPAAVADRVNGSGLWIGVSAAVTGTAVVSPVVLAYFVVRQLSGDDEAGRLRDLYLANVDPWIPRLGGLVAALRDWLWFSLAACAAGGLIGLGDSLRVSDGGIGWGRWVAGSSTIVTSELYVLALASLSATWVRSRFMALLGATVLPIVALVLLPVAVEAQLLAIVRSAPLSPLWAVASGPAFGRYDLDMSSAARYVTMAGWFTVSIAGTWLANKHNRAVLTESGTEVLIRIRR